MVSARRYARDWRLYAAAGVVAALSLGLANAQERPKPAPPRQPQAAAFDQGASDAAPARDMLKPVAQSDDQPNTENSRPPEQAAAQPPSRWTDNAVAWSAIVQASFTVVLAVLTWRLWVVGRGQHEAAMKSAKAAEDAAGALPTVERAYIYPEIISAGEMPGLLAAAHLHFLETMQADTPASETAEVIFRLINLGKTPGFLRRVSVAVGVGPLKEKTVLTVKEAILAAGEPTGALAIKMDRGLTYNQRGHILAHTAHIAFIGTIVYADIWGAEQTTDFHFKWDLETKDLVLVNVWSESEDQQT